MALSVEKKGTTAIDKLSTEPPLKKSRLLLELEDTSGFTKAADRKEQEQLARNRRTLPITSVNNR